MKQFSSKLLNKRLQLYCAVQSMYKSSYNKFNKFTKIVIILFMYKTQLIKGNIKRYDLIHHAWINMYLAVNKNSIVKQKVVCLQNV